MYWLGKFIIWRSHIRGRQVMIVKPDITYCIGDGIIEFKWNNEFSYLIGNVSEGEVQFIDVGKNRNTVRLIYDMVYYYIEGRATAYYTWRYNGFLTKSPDEIIAEMHIHDWSNWPDDEF